MKRLSRLVPVLVCIGIAMSALPAWSLTLEEARHLLVRTGYGATYAEIDRLRPLDRAAAVDLILSEAQLPAGGPRPSWADQNPMTVRSIDDPAVAERLLQAQGAELQAWWIERMLISPTPLRERMTLFWHGHFATALSKVRSPQLMLRQNGLLRRHALGDFRALLRGVVTDPAMLLYLDGASSTAAAPNENFAREIMELFTLGVGQYGEADIRAAARALTGWVVHPATGDAVFVSARHDAGEKALFGATGPWDADDVVRILLDQPQTARFIVGKVWGAFVSTPPQQATLLALADEFGADYRIEPLVRAILLSDAFWAEGERGAMIAGPVDWVVGTLRMLDAYDTPAGPVAALCAELGQALFEPPNVAGWPGGNAWIAPTTLALRQDVVRGFIAGRSAAAEGSGLASRRSAALVRWLDGLPLAWRLPERLRVLVLPLAPASGAALPVADSPDPEVLADLVRGWLSDPVSQLR